MTREPVYPAASTSNPATHVQAGLGSVARQGTQVDDLLEELVPRLYRFALRLTRNMHHAEDITQETVLRVCHKRGQLRDEAAARVWMFRIAHNLWKDSLRTAGVQQRAMRLVGALEEASSTPTKADSAYETASILTAIDELPTRQREVLHLFACEQLRIADIASVLGVSRDAVKSSLSIARQTVRQRLERARTGAEVSS